MGAIGNWTSETVSTTGTGHIYVTGPVETVHAEFRDTVPAGLVEYSVIDGVNREVGIGTFNGTNEIQRTTIIATLVAGVFDDSSPTAISLSGNATVSSSLRAGFIDAILLDYLKHTGGTVTNYGETLNARGSITGAQTIDLSLGNVVTATITGATTFTFTTTHANTSFTCLITNGGTNVTWPTIKWDENGEPDLSVAGDDLFTFTRINSVWYGGRLKGMA